MDSLTSWQRPGCNTPHTEEHQHRNADDAASCTCPCHTPRLDGTDPVAGGMSANTNPVAPLGEDAPLREAVRLALAAHAKSFDQGFREGDHDPDFECPWGMGEMPWEDFADAVLDALGLEQVGWFWPAVGHLAPLNRPERFLSDAGRVPVWVTAFGRSGDVS